VAVVLGAHAAEIRGHIDAAPVLIVENRQWADGMGGSLRVGLEALLAARADLDAVIILLCDQPLLSTALVRALIQKREERGNVIVASEYAGMLGVPALFGREVFGDLLALDNSAGAKKVIAAHRAIAVAVSFPEGAIDVDTPDDFQRLRHFSTEDLCTQTIA
jgi:molybdenum cofactor cytidylyltransferase